MARRSKADNLREACLTEALAIIAGQGLEQLSLREVARRLGVSHQAPYKHFASRDHLLAELLTRSFDDFANRLAARPATDDPQADLAALGRAYLEYAAAHPLQYRLMFGTPLPDPTAHPTMMAQAQRAFGLLHAAIRRLGLAADPDLDALYVWSTMHGLASILPTSMFARLTVAQHPPAALIEHVLTHIGSGLHGDAAANSPPRASTRHQP